MKINSLEKLKNVAEQLGVPYDIHEYIGKAPEFCVYQVDNISSDNFADNRAHARIAHVRLSYIQPIDKSYDATMWKIIDLMTAEGFTEPLVGIDIQDDTKKTVLLFSADIKL